MKKMPFVRILENFFPIIRTNVLKCPTAFDRTPGFAKTAVPSFSITLIIKFSQKIKAPQGFLCLTGLSEKNLYVVEAGEIFFLSYLFDIV